MKIISGPHKELSIVIHIYKNEPASQETINSLSLMDILVEPGSAVEEIEALG